MNFTIDHVTVAGHAVLIFALIRLVVVAVRVHQRGELRRAAVHFVGMGAMMLALTLALERTYYSIARLLRPHGVDLYMAHPAPMLLSVFVLLGTYCITASLDMMLYKDSRAAAKRHAVEFIIILIPFTLLAVVVK